MFIISAEASIVMLMTKYKTVDYCRWTFGVTQLQLN